MFKFLQVLRGVQVFKFRKRFVEFQGRLGFTMLHVVSVTIQRVSTGFGSDSKVNIRVFGMF